MQKLRSPIPSCSPYTLRPSLITFFLHYAAAATRASSPSPPVYVEPEPVQAHALPDVVAAVDRPWHLRAPTNGGDCYHLTWPQPLRGTHPPAHHSHPLPG